MNEIKQRKINLNEDEINSTNNENKNDELNNVLSIINRIYQIFEHNLLLGEQPNESNLPKWVKVSKKRFDTIKNKVRNAKDNYLQARPKRSKVINFNESNKLLHEIENRQITYEEALKKIKNIRSDINKIISMQNLNLNQINVLNTLFMVNVEVNKEDDFEIFKEKSDKEKQESDEQLGTRDMAELESKESAVEKRNQQGQGLKILTPNRMLSRLPITKDR